MNARRAEHEHALHVHAAPAPDGGRSGLMILIGNSVHNFCDGIVIAAAFIADDALGVATTLAIVAHAVPQQVGDFAVLHAFRIRAREGVLLQHRGRHGDARRRAAAYVALADMQQLLPDGARHRVAASLLYVAVADLIPSLHRRSEPLETAKQMLWIALGIAIIASAHVLLEPR